MLLCKHAFLTFALLLFAFNAKTQALGRKQLYGSYTNSTGQPGRTITREGGEEIHLMPVVYDITTITLKRFRRCTKSTMPVTHGVRSFFKGRWEIRGDTLVLTFQGQEEKLLIQREDSGEDIRYLLFLSHPGGYSREYK